MSIPNANPNPFAVSGNPTVAAESPSVPAPGTVGAVPQAVPGVAGLPGAGGEFEFNVNYDDVVSNRMPVGMFPLVVSDLAPSTSQAGNPMHVFTFTCIDPKNAGKESKLFCALQPNALWKHQETMKALGMPAQGGVTFRRSDVVGRCCMGEFVEEPDRNDTTKTRVNLSRIHPHPNGLGIRLTQLQSGGQGQGLPAAQGGPAPAPTAQPVTAAVPR